MKHSICAPTHERFPIRACARPQEWLVVGSEESDFEDGRRLPLDVLGQR
jgi:hypothetical protein